jgi:hypothetical protein
MRKWIWFLVVATLVLGVCLGVLLDRTFHKERPPIYLHTGDLSIPLGGR